MTNFIPIFPLNLVIYPDEVVNLHIFEERYKQLIRESRDQQKPFGVPAVLNKSLQDRGTLTELVEVVKEYDDGKMDIRVRGVKIFRTLEVITSVPDKLYSGAIVNYPENKLDDGSRDLMQMIILAVRDAHRLLNVSKDFGKPDNELVSYDIAHHAGLSVEEEYELLGLMREIQRQEYLKRHLQKMLPMLKEVNELKEKVRLNGHFRNPASLDLNFDRPGSE